MARGPSRAASQNAFRGTVGATRTQIVQVTMPAGEIVAATVHVAVDALADPELAERLQADALNTVEVPVVYHDPAAEVMVLVLGESDRRRELAERARLYGELAAEKVAVPAYVRDFGVVFGGTGLRAYLEGRAEAALERARGSDGAATIERDRAQLERDRAQLERRRGELTAREGDLDRARAEIERTHREHERRAAELDVAGADLAQRLAEADRLRGELARAREAAPVAPARAPSAPVAPAAEAVDESTNPFDLQAETTIAPAIAPPEPPVPAGADPLTTEARDLPAGGSDPWIDGFLAGQARAAIAVPDGEPGARLALRLAGPASALVRGGLDVRVQLHRTAAYPVVAITIGSPAALRGAGHAHATALLDIAAEPDKRALAALEKQFTLAVDLVLEGRRVRRAVVIAPLAGNVGYVVRAAQDHLRTMAAEHVETSFARGKKAVLAPDFDLLGLAHDEAAEWKAEKIEQLDTAAHVRRAIAMARRFARPSREDYLVCVRGYPLERWHHERRAALARAVELGLWMGSDLAQVAVSEGLARSRKDLIARLDTAFERVLADTALNDLDVDAAEDNRSAIAEEGRALGVAVSQGGGTGKARAIASDAEPVASGTIEGGKGRPVTLDFKPKTVDDLIALLDDRAHRVAAALELCERGDPRAARPVIASVRRMSRSEAVRVLGSSVKFGEAAAPALTAGLASSKAFLRHGCALALALLRTEAGTESVIDLLLSEPTEIWREIARAVGQVGAPALMTLASRYGRLGDRATPAARERIAWAMAHVGVRGGKQAVETLASGHSAVAPVARDALERMAPAARDDLHVRAGATGGSAPGRDVTVNRAFSRRFFEALERGLPELAAEGLEALDASGPMEMLDESDLVEDLDEEDGEAELDESDLIPT
jgi:hypothetical protein